VKNGFMHNFIKYTRAFLAEIRVFNLLMIFSAQWIIGYSMQFEAFNQSYYSSIFIIIFGTTLITAAGYLQNNLMDLKLDVECKNKERFFLLHFLKSSKKIILLLYFLGITLIAFYSFSITNYSVFYILLWSVILLNLYNIYFKKVVFIGNITVALLCVLSIIIIYKIFPIHNGKINFFENPVLLFVGFYSYLREFVKDFEDQNCDAQFGYKTFPILISEKNSFFYFASLLILFVTYLFFDKFKLEIIGFLGFYHLILLYFFYKKNYNKVSALLKILFLIGIIFIWKAL
jgi:4-hydroxybenzoate polyprenyltransferase